MAGSLQVTDVIMRDLNICLLGMSGSGKTASLKSIVAKEGINPRGGWNSVVEDCQHGKVMSQGRSITVVDSPSLFSTHMTSEKDQMDQFQKSVAEMSRDIGGYDALVLVLSYGRRFGEEDKKTIHILKTVLGHDWLKTHGMVLMTGGDNLSRDLEDDAHQTFDEYCHEIRGPVREILEECNYRCVLFDNVCRDERNLERQREMLLSVAGTIANSRSRWQFQNPERTIYGAGTIAYIRSRWQFQNPGLTIIFMLFGLGAFVLSLIKKIFSRFK